MWSLYSYGTVSSTMDVARALFLGGTAVPFVVTADHQEKGRGRADRVWESPVGNLMATLVMSCPDVSMAPLYAYVAALSVLDVLKPFMVAPPLTLKWPNDILLGGKKMGGVLITLEENAQGKGVLCMGIGLNLVDHPHDTPYPAASLNQGTFRENPPTVTEILQTLIPAVEYWHRVLVTQGFEPLRQGWLQARDPAHAAISMRRDGTGAVGDVEGAFHDLDHTGALVLAVESSSGEKILERFSVGDVFFSSKTK